MGLGNRFVRFGLLFSGEDNGERDDDCHYNDSDYHNSNNERALIWSASYKKR